MDVQQLTERCCIESTEPGKAKASSGCATKWLVGHGVDSDGKCSHIDPHVRTRSGLLDSILLYCKTRTEQIPICGCDHLTRTRKRGLLSTQLACQV